MKREPADNLGSDTASPLKRRGVLLGTGAAALAGVAAVVASRGVPEATPAAHAEARKEEGAAGYRLSAHVKRYYETIRV